MVKRDVFVVTLIVFVSGLIIFNVATVYFFGVPLSPVAITGKVVETGYVLIYVEGAPRVITIYSPLNITYDNTSYVCSNPGSHPKCDNFRYELSLNTSADFLLEEVGDIWEYTLYDLKHDVYIVGARTAFTPGDDIPFVRWGNLLTVFANERDADWINQSVVFNVEVPNSAPLIQNFTTKMFVCESDIINSLDDSFFNVWDVDEEEFRDRDDNKISPGEIFGIDRTLPKIDDRTSRAQIVSVPFDKSHLRSHIETVTVKDSSGRSDFNITNITVIEINNPPVIYVNEVPKPIGIVAKTIHMNGTDSVFNHQMDVRDVEDGNSNDGNMIFNLTWITGPELDFEFNSSNGNMSYTPQQEDQGGVNNSKTYELRVCVLDNELSDVPENFSVCADDHNYTAITVCDDFSLTITDANRVPSIDSHSPFATSFSTIGTVENLFSVTVSDDDMTGGTSPSIDWYIDGVLNKSNENISSDSLSHTFGCGVSGAHTVTMITSDGLANASLTWDISVDNVVCPTVTTSAGGRGGGGGGSLSGICNELWSCHSWGLCQNVERSFSAGSLSPEDFSSAMDLCFQNEYDERFCGFQITKCFDIQRCNNTEVLIPKPIESQVCYFTENPNCIDGITNCHDGDCELLVDCGGPCDPCSTCSDGKRNQGENGVDCGGPCPFSCESESPFRSISVVLVSLLVVLAGAAIFIIIKLVSILRYRFFLSGKKRKRR